MARSVPGLSIRLARVPTPRSLVVLASVLAGATVVLAAVLFWAVSTSGHADALRSLPTLVVLAALGWATTRKPALRTDELGAYAPGRGKAVAWSSVTKGSLRFHDRRAWLDVELAEGGHASWILRDGLEAESLGRCLAAWCPAIRVEVSQREFSSSVARDQNQTS